MKLIKVKDYAEMSEKAADIIMDQVNHHDQPVLGLATGSTPEGMYQNLIQQHQNGNISFKNVTTFNLDEYVHLDKENPNSYHHYMHENLFNHIDVKTENIHIPNGLGHDLDGNCRSYEGAIKDADAVDLQVLGIGVNGHIGFNEPGTDFTSRTHIVELDASTREANARFFETIDEVPTKAISMGIQTIMDSKQIMLLVSGVKKHDALERLLNGEVNEDCPATVLQRHPNVIVIADEAAVTGSESSK